MTDRIRVDWSDIDKVPSQPPSPLPPASGGGDDWGKLSPRVPQPGIEGPTPLLRRHWFYMSMAGALGGLLTWALTDGLGNNIDKMSRADSNAISMLITLLCGGLVTGLVASSESFVSLNTAHAVRQFILGLLLGAIAAPFTQALAGHIAAPLREAALESNASGDSALGLVMAWRTVVWALSGMGIGILVGVAGRAKRKVLLGLVGGLGGGMVGGLVFDPVSLMTDTASLSRFVGFTIVGLAIGLGISLAEEAAKTAWLRIEAGRLIGKQFIVYRDPTRLGALPSNDIYLFKDAAVSPVHALIQKRSDGHWLVPEGQAPVFVNGARINQHRLRGGDLIGIGETLLRYNERKATA